MFGPGGFIDEYGMVAAVVATAGLAAGGFAKGVVGFALPLIALSIMGSFLPFAMALALLILPTLASNVVQSLRDGPRAALASIRHFWRMNLCLVIMIAFSAQLVVALPDAFFFGLLGTLITVFGLTQTIGWQPRFPEHHQGAIESAVGLVAGFFGGVSGVWGPPVVMYLISRNIGKVEMVRVQALAFTLGSIVLTAAHWKSGVLNGVTLPASAWMILPSLAGMFLGYRVQDRLDQQKFRRVTLIILIVAGLNLLRRAFFP
jgi:uncharacterized protein